MLSFAWKGRLLTYAPVLLLLSFSTVLPLLIVCVWSFNWTTLLVLIITNTAALAGVPQYLAVYRLLIYPFRLYYTGVLCEFLCSLSLMIGCGNMVLDITGVTSLEQLYGAKKKSVRRRMLHYIPKQVADKVPNFRLRQADLMSTAISWDNLRIQLKHAQRVSGASMDVYYQLVSLLLCTGTLTEYYSGRQLLAHSISIKLKSSLTVMLYAADDPASKMGLWFFNIRTQLERAIRDADVRLVNGTMANHKMEAKNNVGFVLTKEEKLSKAAYGIVQLND